jgi:prevent-host-death family protein
MTAISATAARKDLYNLISEVNDSSDPITITNKRGKNAVLISENDWNALQETLYLNSIPGMADSIVNADFTDAKKYDPDEEW